MCVIVYKPRGISLPSMHILKECTRINKDGIGFMFPQNGLVRIRRGFSSVHSMLMSLKDMGFDEDLPLIMHFRIGTSGIKAPINSHPFPISNNRGDFFKLNHVFDMGIAHNGILYQWSRNDDIFCDTARYIMIALSGMTNMAILKSRDLDKIDKMLPIGKFAIMYGDGEVQRFGIDWSVYGDCLFSNSGPIPYVRNDVQYDTYCNTWKYSKRNMVKQIANKIAAENKTESYTPHKFIIQRVLSLADCIGKKYECGYCYEASVVYRANMYVSYTNDHSFIYMECPKCKSPTRIAEICSLAKNQINQDYYGDY